MAFLTDRILAPNVTANDLIHIVITGDTSQNPAGSSYKATMGQVLDLINPTTLTGGTYNPVTGTITFFDDNGGSFNVTGLLTGYTNTEVTGFTYNNANTFTVIENDGTTHSATFSVVTGLTINGNLNVTGTTSSRVISATTYQNLPTDIRVTGATYSNNTFTYTNNTGGTFSVLFNTMTGLTINGNLSATTYQNLPTDIRVTGGTYSGGTAIFTNNTGGTFSVSGFTTPFTGNTSGTCINNLYVTNVIGCSPLRIQPNSTDPVYISQSGGNVAIGTPTLDGVAPEALVVSGSSTTSYNLIVGRANVNNYAQLNIVNKSTGNTSSADVVATNNTGTELVNFIDMGINGSNYSAGIIGVANDAYLFSTGRELYIGNATTGATSNIKFFAGNAALDVDMIISGSTGFVGIGTTSPTSRLDVNGTTKSSVISATTYQNLPTDVRVTGATYSNNTFTYTNNTGGTFSVLFNTMTGLTINGNLNVTGTIFSTGSTQFISTTGITISAVTLSTGTTYNGINYVGNVDLTIPSPSGFTGLKIIVKDEGGNAGTYRIRLTPSVGTIDGNSYVDMNINYMSLTLVARNNNWWII
jgi:hypothetical protein